jgi:pSer/pThr/pTyr-binding forkhead associated (FHA) protein
MSPQGFLLILRVLIALVLYAFFTLAILAVWRSVPRGTQLKENIPETYAIEYQEERLVHGHRLRAVNLIGRAADNTIVLSDERVSAHHARITFTGGQWLLEDLGSRNGTFVNELPMEGPLVVTFEDRIQVGAVILEIAFDVPSADMTFTI